MLDIGRKPSQVISVIFTSKIAKIAEDKSSHCLMASYYCLRLLSTALSHRMVAQWVHSFRPLKGSVPGRIKPKIVARRLIPKSAEVLAIP